MEELKVGSKYKCTHQISHPNMGVLFRKNKIYELQEISARNIVLDGINLYPEWLKTHFELVEETKEETI